MKKQLGQNLKDYETRSCDNCDYEDTELEFGSARRFDPDSGQWPDDGSEVILYCPKCKEVMIPDLEEEEYEGQDEIPEEGECNVV